MSLSSDEILDLFSSGMSIKEIARQSFMHYGAVRQRITSHPGYVYAVKSHKLARTLRKNTDDGLRFKINQATRKRRQDRLAKNLCVDCGKKVRPYKLKTPGRPPSGYRCRECNNRRQAKKRVRNNG